MVKKMGGAEMGFSEEGQWKLFLSLFLLEETGGQSHGAPIVNFSSVSCYGILETKVVFYFSKAQSGIATFQALNGFMWQGASYRQSFIKTSWVRTISVFRKCSGEFPLWLSGNEPN